MRAAQVARGLGWTTAAALVNVLAQVAFTAVLARQLEPAAFGLFAMAGIALRFTSFFAQWGTFETLVQAPALRPGMVATALAVGLGSSLLMYALTAAAAPLASMYFQAETLAPLLLAFGLSLPLSALGAIPTALLSREGRFGPLSAAEVGSYVAGFGVVAVACAQAGLGAWSLVWGTLAQQALFAAAGFALARPDLSWGPSQPDWARIVRPGTRYSVIGFLEFLWGNVEALAIGRSLGAGALGLLNRAQMLAALPTELAMRALTRVMFPALSAMQTDRQRMADGFLVLLLLKYGTSAIVAAALCAAAPDVVLALLGPRWTEAAPVMGAIALAVPAAFVYSACGVTLDSLGTLERKLRAQAVLLVFKVVLILALLPHGLVAVAIGVVLGECVRAVVGLVLVCGELPVSRPALVQALAGGTLAAGLVYASMVGVQVLCRHADAGLVLRLAAQAAAAGVAIAICAWVALRASAAWDPLQRLDTVRRWRDAALAWRPAWSRH
jgi:O-antigen/teichoic acid export membrane protein